MKNALRFFSLAVGLCLFTGCGQKGDGYVGSESCKECHERFYNLWSPSHHGKAMQPYTDEFAASNLTAQTEAIDIAGVAYQADISAGKGYIVERGPKGVKKFKIEHVMGGKNMYFFLTMLERGRLQVTPISYNVKTKVWYDTTASMVRHFGLTEDEALHWTDSMLTFNTSCFNCHVSQLRKNYDLVTDTYKTEWGEPGINCETCHGPSQKHNQICREAAARGEKPKELGLLSWTTLSHEQRNAACNTCHAKASPLTLGFEPGGKFFDHYDLTGLEDRDFYPDGRDLGENYTMTGWRMSPCVKAGELDCIHCHTSSGRYRFKKENRNGACLPCHAERVADIKAHSHHALDKENSPTCVGCHMPLTEFSRMDRSDHSMRPPSPAATLEFKSPNACNICHEKKDAEWAAETVKKWHPKGKWSERILREGRLVQWARSENWEHLGDMLAYIQEEDADEIVTLSIVRLLYACDDVNKMPVLRKMLQHKSPLVRAAAATTLGGYDMESVRALLPLLDDELLLVRVRVASSLMNYPRNMLPPEQRARFLEVEKDMVTSMTCRPDHWASHYNYGNYWGQLNEKQKALESYELAIKMRPDVVLCYVNASITAAQLGDGEKSYRYLLKAYELEPKSGAVNMNLGLLMAERGDMVKAEKHLRVALAERGTMPQSAYNLAVIVGGRDPAEAAELCRKALEAMPGNEKYQQGLQYYLNEVSKR